MCNNNRGDDNNTTRFITMPIAIGTNWHNTIVSSTNLQYKLTLLLKIKIIIISIICLKNNNNNKMIIL